MYGVLCTSVPRRQVWTHFWILEKTAPKPILTAYKMPIFQSKAVKLLGCKDCCPAIITVSQLNIRCIKVKVMEAQTCQNAQIRFNTLQVSKGYGGTRKCVFSDIFHGKCLFLMRIDEKQWKMTFWSKKVLFSNILRTPAGFKTSLLLTGSCMERLHFCYFNPITPKYLCGGSKLLLLSFSKPKVRHTGQSSPRILHPQEKLDSRTYFFIFIFFFWEISQVI